MVLQSEIITQLSELVVEPRGMKLRKHIAALLSSFIPTSVVVIIVL
jgi:hypothetical protein